MHIYAIMYIDNFNSHAHVERDLYAMNHDGNYYISTHTLTWSVTNISKRLSTLWGFQLTRSRGA